MKKIVLITLIGLFCAVGQSQEAKKASFKTPMKNKEVSSFIEKYMSTFPDNSQVSIALMKDSKIEYIGVIKKNNSLEIIDNKRSSFEIGSITKVFTSLLLADQVSKGTMSLDDPIQKHLPFTLNQSSKDGKEITLKMLANHTSGLPRLPDNIISDMKKYKEDNPYRDYDSIRFNNYLKNTMKINTVPGTKSAYSNLGVGLLGYILTLHTNKSFEELLKEQIFTPLKMKNSSNYVDKSSIVIGQDHLGNETSNWELNVLGGAGSIKSTVEDMTKFIFKNMEGGSIYDMAQKPTFRVNEYNQMGLGWNITNIEEWGVNMFSHNGGTGGYRSMITVSRKNKIGVVILSNVSAYSVAAGNIDMLARDLMKELRTN